MLAWRKDTHLGRYRQVAEVLGHHGLGYLASLLGLERFIPFPQTVFGHRRHEEKYTPPAHVRMALAELGTTFIKLGQVFSTRADLLPPDYLAELAKLQDSAPAVPFEVIGETLAAELGRPVEEVFASFDPVPLAAASIGQAHAATLRDGTEVVVKVRRPGVVEQVETDLEILGNLASAASRRWEFADQYDLVGLVQEFSLTLRAELDYLREAQNVKRFAENFADDPRVHIPRVFWETTTSRTLTLERIRGVKIDDLAALDAAGVDRHALAERAVRLLLKMVFEDGFFHADPHPGNFFIEPGGRIGLIDFGMVGVVDERTRGQLARLLLAVTSQDADRLVDAILEFGVSRGRVDRVRLRRDLGHLVSRYYGQSLGEVTFGSLLGDALAVVRRHRLQLPSSLALLLKTMVMDEGLGVRLDPTFRLTSVLTPYAERLIWRQYAPGVWMRQLGETSMEAARLGVELPQQMRRFLAELERGDFQVSVRASDFESMVRRLERLANRIVLGIIAAAFINGLAVLVSVYRPPGWELLAGVAFAFGFLLATLLGMLLAWSIIRSGQL